MELDVFDPAHRDARIRDMRRATEHLAVRIDSALTDPAVDLFSFMGLIKEYTQHLCKLKAYHNGQAKRKRG